MYPSCPAKKNRPSGERPGLRSGCRLVGEVDVHLTHRILDAVASKEHDVLEKRVRITHDTGGILDIAGRVGQNRTVRPIANRLPEIAEARRVRSLFHRSGLRWRWNSCRQD